GCAEDPVRSAGAEAGLNRLRVGGAVAAGPRFTSPAGRGRRRASGEKLRKIAVGTLAPTCVRSVGPNRNDVTTQPSQFSSVRRDGSGLRPVTRSSAMAARTLLARVFLRSWDSISGLSSVTSEGRVAW